MSPRGRSATEPVERALLDKIPDPELRGFALGASSEPQLVLVELDLPRPKLNLGAERSIGGRSRRARSLEGTDEQAKSTRARSAAVVDALGGMGLSARPLRSSGVVLVEVLPDQLRKVVDLEGVRKIHPNRRVR